MKKQRYRPLAVIVALTLLLSLLAACGASTAKNESADTMMPQASPTAASYAGGMSYDMAAGEAAPAEMMTETAAQDDGGNGVWNLADGDTQPVAVDERKIVKYSDMQLQTKEFDSTLEKLLALVTENGGYIDSQSVDGYNLYNKGGKYYSRNAYIAARIPTDKLGDITAAVAELCNVNSKSESRQDITDTYYDAETRLNTLRTQETRLLELLEQAAGLSEVIELERALSDVQYQIESMQGQLRRMDNQVAYSYLNMNLEEVVEYTENISEPKTFGERLGIAAGNAWNNIVDTCQGIVLFVVEYAVVILIWLVIIALALWLIIRLVRLLRRKKAPAEKQTKRPFFAKKDTAPAQQTPAAPEDKKE